MNKSQRITFFGSIALVLGAFLPWISVPNLFGKAGAGYEGIAIGWEGDGVVTGGIGLLLLLGALFFKGRSKQSYSLAGVILASLAGIIVVQDFLRIGEINPASGLFAATEVGLYVTLLGAFITFFGGIQGLQISEPKINT